MKKITIAILTLFCLLTSFKVVKAQEFMCDIRVTAPTIEGTDRRVFEDMQRALYEFINNRKWTNINFKMQERIEGTILITIKERVSSDEYKGSINLILRRPIYRTAYNSNLLNYVDENFQFRYIEAQPLDFNSTSFTSNLTSVMAFYAYYFLGLEFDTYSLYGGDPFFKMAESIVNTAQSANELGWKSFDGNKNRYWLSENMTNASYRPIRQFMYEYHRLGLDIMSEKADEGRSKITETLEYLQQMYKQRSTLLWLQLIVEAKRDEFINIYSKGSQQEKTRAVNILREIDPANSTKYDAILRN